MKLIVAGATGYIGTEIVRKALSHPRVTSILALARRTTPVPQNAGPGADSSKLKSVVCDNFEDYSESVKKELSGADACIWVIAITPTKSKTRPWEEVRKTCYDYAVKGLETITQLPRDPSADKPFRFIYTSGSTCERDQTKRPLLLGDYMLMRGSIESFVLNYGKEHKGAVDVAVAKPGLVVTPGNLIMPMWILSAMTRSTIDVPLIGLREVAATLLDQAVNGIEKDTLFNRDLNTMGQKVLAEQQNSS